MGDDLRRPDDRARRSIPRATPVPRRRVARCSSGVTALAGGGLGTILEGCAGPPVPVRAGHRPGHPRPGHAGRGPVHRGPGRHGDGRVHLAGQEGLRRDHRLRPALHARPVLLPLGPDRARFLCDCHDGQFALDGTVLAGKPPRPPWSSRSTSPAAVVEVDVPGNFETPKESLPGVAGRASRAVRPLAYASARAMGAGGYRIPRCASAPPCIALLSPDGWERDPRARDDCRRSVSLIPPAKEYRCHSCPGSRP